MAPKYPIGKQHWDSSTFFGQQIPKKVAPPNANKFDSVTIGNTEIVGSKLNFVKLVDQLSAQFPPESDDCGCAMCAVIKATEKKKASRSGTHGG